MSVDTDTTIQTLTERRDELDVPLGDVAAYVAEHHSLAESTLSSRIGAWERGETTPTDEDLAALAEALDEIEAVQNYEHPECVVCGRVPDNEPDETEDGPRCITCTYRAEGP